MDQQTSELQITVDQNIVSVRRGSSDGFWSRYSTWEPETQTTFKRFIDAQHSYIDMGTWIGPTLLLGCQLAKRAYGIEPDPIAYAELAANINCNQILTRNVELFNICITAVSGKVSFGSRGEGGDSMSSLLFSNGKTRWTVDGMNFQEWIEQNQINDCNFIKIDIEGGEYSVLPTMVAYLRFHRPTLHLSLHPDFLGEGTVRGMKATLKHSLLRLGNSMRLLTMLSFYKYCHDPFAKVPSLHTGTSLRSRIHLYHRLASLNLKPLTFVMVCLLAVCGRPSALVFTDHEW